MVKSVKRVRKHPGPRKRSRSGPSRSTAASRVLERVLASFAHDVRTPLTGILALSELLATSELGAREREWVGALKSSAEHLAALATLVVDGARSSARGLVLRPEVFDLPALAEAMAAAFSARAQAKGLQASVVIAPDLPQHARGDQVRLRAAVENLVDNAVKFTEAGQVRFEVARASGRAARGRLGVVFALSDSGIGMTAAQIRRLFRPFAQASAAVAEKFGGAGLGLAFVKRLAKAMGGDLTVQSRPGGGSAFRLSVMLDAAEPSDARTAPEQRKQVVGTPLRILCAEDNPYGRVIMNTILSELGHRPDFVGSGEAAIAAAERDGYDVVLMDIVLAGLDGLEATRRIRALPGAAGRVPVIGLSGHASRTSEATARAAGMNAFLQKPISPRLLADTMEALIAR